MTLCAKGCGHSSWYYITPLPWRHNGHDGVSNHQPYDCLLNCLFRRRSKKTSKLRVTVLCEGNSPVTGEFPGQRTSNAGNFPFDDVIMRCRTVKSDGTSCIWVIYVHMMPYMKTDSLSNDMISTCKEHIFMIDEPNENCSSLKNVCHLSRLTLCARMTLANALCQNIARPILGISCNICDIRSKIIWTP